MVFVGRRKTVIQKALKRCVLFLVLITTISALIINAVFAAPRVSYPVEIIWENDDISTRPAQVSLQLKNSGGTSYGSPTIFTASENQDPNNPNRWFGYVSYYNSSQTSLHVVEADLGSDYTITQAGQATCQSNQTLSIVDVHQADSSYLAAGGDYSLTNMDFLVYKVNGTYYGWSAEYGSTKLTAINNAIHSAIDSNITVPSSNWKMGSWEQYNGSFAPTISKQITNPQNIYRYGDTVEFQVYVTNSESYPITNVEVDEQLLGAKFLAASGYTLASNDTKAIISTIPAGGTVVLYAEYDILDDVTQTRTNTVEITDASADNYYFLDTTQSYIASAQFATQSWQDVPVLTGVNTNSTTFYYCLMVLGTVGIVGVL